MNIVSFGGLHQSHYIPCCKRALEERENFMIGKTKRLVVQHAAAGYFVGERTTGREKGKGESEKRKRGEINCYTLTNVRANVRGFSFRCSSTHMVHPLFQIATAPLSLLVIAGYSARVMRPAGPYHQLVP